MVRNVSSRTIMMLTGMDQATAAEPAITRTSRISSVAYATEERALEEKTARARRFDNRSSVA